MAAETGGKIDPMHQFLIEPLFGRHWIVNGYDLSFTNSALWMVITVLSLAVFMAGGMKRELVPGRWQAATEGFTGFVQNMLTSNIGPEGKRFVPYVFSLFMFILFANVLGLLPFGVVPGWPWVVRVDCHAPACGGPATTTRPDRAHRGHS